MGFSAGAGGTVTITGPPRPRTAIQQAAEQASAYPLGADYRVQGKLSAQELALLQDLNPAEIQPASPLPLPLIATYPLVIWQGVESALRHYAEAYF